VLITDKTGTITQGKPSVEQVVALNGGEEMELLAVAASLNQSSEHPLAAAVLSYAAEKGLKISKVEEFIAVSGKGVKGRVNGKLIALGNKSLMEEVGVSIPVELQGRIDAEQQAAKTVSYIAVDGKVQGYLTISDAIKYTSKAAVQALMDMGIEVRMITGDSIQAAKAVAGELNLKHFIAEALPEAKLREIKRLQGEGMVVAMAGDGINDAPALAQADVGIAMGTGTDVAIESAAITLLKGDLQGIVKAKKLSSKVMKNIRQNLFFAFFYNVVGIPLAAGVLYPVFGILLSPMIAAAAMSISSVSVISNSLRLRNSKL
jgi:Cu+-exporting ATPase